MSSIRPELKFTDVAEERGFYRRYLNLPAKPEKTIRLVNRTDYFTAVGSDAEFVAENVYHTSSVLKDCRLDANLVKSFEEPAKYVTMSLQIVTALLKLCLIDLGYKIEIYDKCWKLERSASPGYVEDVSDLMTVPSDASILIASLKIQLNTSEGHCVFGTSFIDTSNFKIGILNIIDNEVYSNLESFIIQLGVRECLVQDLTPNSNSSTELQKIMDTIDRCGCVVTLIKSSEYSEKSVEGTLSKILGNELALSLPQKYSSSALASCNALINYLKLLNDQNQLGKYELIEHSLKEFVKLDASAIKALNLFPQEHSGSGSNGITINNSGKITSLYQLLNNCKTHAGSRMLMEWIKQPLTDVSKINERHDLVEFMVDQIELRQVLQTDYLPSFPDIRRLRKKLSKNGNLEDVLKMYDFARAIPGLSSTLTTFLEDANMDKVINDLVSKWWLIPMNSDIEPLSKFQEMVETTVDFDAYEKHNKYMIRTQFDEELAQIRSRLDELKSKISEIHLEASDELGFDPDKKLKLENHHLHGWCMRLTRNDAKDLRNYGKYIELSTVKAGIYFSTRELKEIAQETTLTQKEYDQKQNSLVKEICGITLTYTPVFEKLSLVLAHLDVIASFAHSSSYAPIPYVKPVMNPLHSFRKTKLTSSRHPVLEIQDDISFIENDVHLEQKTSEFQIITGPNMGGKSTYIRQVGLISLMAQIGCFVPCQEAEISVVDAILCRVGAGDSQLKGVSTFMVEMLEIASILKNATKNSLIIVDELGRGTSTYDGFGLAWAIAEHIATKIGCFALFATHFHELTPLAEKLSNVKNLHMVAHVETQQLSVHNGNDITLLYKVEPGISDQSFGIHVAEVVQFPQKIINMAKRKANELEDLKNSQQTMKKHKLTSKDLAEGNTKLKELLKNWLQNVKESGCLDNEKLLEEKSRVEIIELIKKLSTQEHFSSNKYFEYIQDLL